MSASNGAPGSGSSSSSGSSVQPVIVADDEGVDLRELVSILWSGKWIIAAITVVVLVLALIYAFLATPIYEANALIQIEQQQSPLSGDQTGVLSMLFPMASPAQTEIAIMKSRSVLQPTVLKENLNIIVNGGDPVNKEASPDDPAVVITSLVVPNAWMGEELTLVSKGAGRFVLQSPDGDKLLAGQVGEVASAENGAVKILVKRLDVPANSDFPLIRIHDQVAVASLLNRLSVNELGGGRQDTGIVSLTLNGPHPVRLKNILNVLTAQYIQQNVLAQAAQARESLKFINKQLPEIKNQLNEAQTKLTQYRTKKGVVNLDQQAQSMLQSLTTLETQLTQIKLTEAAMKERFTGRYPGIQALQGQKQDINSQINAIQSRISLLPGKEQEYLSLLQKSQMYQQLYAALLSKAQDLQIAQAATVGSARIIDPAVTPIKPIKPRKALIGVLGIVLGLFLGVLIVFLRRALNRAVQDAAEIEREFGLPVYAVVPHSPRQAYLMKQSKRHPGQTISVLAHDAPDDPAVESIRSLRTSLTFTLQKMERKVIAISGCTPGVGKSFMSINLAHVIGLSNTRVLLVDADLRRGYLDRYMGVSKQPGLAGLLRGEVEMEAAIQRAPLHDNVDFLATGPFPANPYELMSTPRLGECIEQWASDYDLVILDVPPVLSVAEGLIIGGYATTNFMVVKAGVQTLQEMRMAQDRMQQNGVRLEGFVFNDLSRQAASYTYGKYAGRYYYDRYGEKPSKSGE